jgi:hypothetical protein
MMWAGVTVADAPAQRCPRSCRNTAGLAKGEDWQRLAAVFHSDVPWGGALLGAGSAASVAEQPSIALMTRSTHAGAGVGTDPLGSGGLPSMAGDGCPLRSITEHYGEINSCNLTSSHGDWPGQTVIRSC